jgi:hypothetical protein
VNTSAIWTKFGSARGSVESTSAISARYGIFAITVAKRWEDRQQKVS